MLLPFIFSAEIDFKNLLNLIEGKFSRTKNVFILNLDTVNVFMPDYRA